MTSVARKRASTLLLISKLSRRGLITPWGIALDILMKSGIPVEHHRTGMSFPAEWEEELWAPAWAVALIHFRIKQFYDTAYQSQENRFPAMDREREGNALQSYLGDPDAVYADLAVAALCENEAISKLAKLALDLPLYGVKRSE